jgi:hypothetical protein
MAISTGLNLSAFYLQNKVDAILIRTFMFGIPNDEKDRYTLCQVSKILDREQELFRDIFFDSIVRSHMINDPKGCFTLDSFLIGFYEGFISKMKDLSENTPRAVTTDEIGNCVYPLNYTEDINHEDTFSPEVGLFTYGNIHSNVVKKFLLENLSRSLCEWVHPFKRKPLFRPVYVLRDSDEQGCMEVCICITPDVYYLCREYVYDNDRFKDRLDNLGCE